MKLAIIGSTGMVGNILLKVLLEQNIKIDNLILVASEKSVNKEVNFNNKLYKVVDINKALKLKPDYAIFSAGSKISKEYAKKFTDIGTIVIDNSSAWRMDKDIPLVIPEVNAKTIKNNKLISNPNCSTIQTVLAISELHKLYNIKRLVISTYQSVSGSGYNGLNQLNNEREGKPFKQLAYPYPIDLNIIPHGGNFLDSGYTEEEEKLVNETHKILDDYNIAITATVARVPVIGGHSVSANIEFEKEFKLSEVINTLKNTKGVVVLDDISKNIYPMPLYVKDKDEVFVGRIRRDFSIKNGLNLWIVADNLRKGAATNAVQILKYLLSK